MPSSVSQFQDLKPRSKHGTVMAVSMMKDEAPFLLEWFAHHLAVGFTDILVYTNDCSDGTDDMLIRLEELGLGYHRRNVIPEGQKPQPSALNHAQAEPLVGAADWVLVFDADEFLSVNHPAAHLEGMLDDTVARGANGVVITWRIFGSGGVVDWSRDPVTEQYTRAAPPLWNKGWGVKTLFKFDPEYWKLGIHRPSIKNKHLETGFPDQVHWLNGSGLPMEDYFKFRGWRSIRRTIGYTWAQMNHYAVKSVDSYAVRKFRGNVNNKKDKYNADYWSLQDRNEVEDRAILRHAPDRARIMAELLKDPVLNRLHHAALERVEARLAEYRQTDAYQQLRESLIKASEVPITQVEAKPPQARDPAKIAALMSEVEKKSQSRPKEERRTETVPGWAAEGGDPYMPPPIDLSAEIANEWVPNHEIALPGRTPASFRPEIRSPPSVAGSLRTPPCAQHRRLTSTAPPPRAGNRRGPLGFLPIRIHPGLARRRGHGRRTTRRELYSRSGRKIARRAGIDNSARLKWTRWPPPLPLRRWTRGQRPSRPTCAIFRPTALRLNRPADVPPETPRGARPRHRHPRSSRPLRLPTNRPRMARGLRPRPRRQGLHRKRRPRQRPGSLQFDLKTP